MIVVDTMWWSRYFGRKGDAYVRSLVAERLAVVHDLVTTELIIGGAPEHLLKKVFDTLPHVDTAPHSVLWPFIERTKPVGIGYVDVHLAFAARDRGYGLLTEDGPLMDYFKRIRR